jgi:hypothetical protein
MEWLHDEPEAFSRSHPRGLAYTLGRDGSGLRAPVIRCRLLALVLGYVLQLVGEVVIMEKEVYQFMFRVINTVEKVFGEFPLDHPYLSGYAQKLSHLLRGEAEYVFLDRVPRRVYDDVKERMNESDLRQVVHYFHIWFCDLPHYDFWVVIFGMRRDSCSCYPVTLVYKHSTFVDDFCGLFLL